MPSWIFAVQHLFQTLLRNLGGLEMFVPAYLLWHSPGDLYIYLVMTTAFLEGVIWQISVSAPSARLSSKYAAGKFAVFFIVSRNLTTIGGILKIFYDHSKARNFLLSFDF